MTQFRKKTRNELEAQITRMLHVSERDTARMIEAARIIEEQTRMLKDIRKLIDSPEASIDPRGMIAVIRLRLDGQL